METHTIETKEKVKIPSISGETERSTSLEQHKVNADVKIIGRSSVEVLEGTSEEQLQPEIRERHVDEKFSIQMDYAPADAIEIKRESRTGVSYPIQANLTGKLTAGEVNDFKKWKMWEDIADRELHALELIWGTRTQDRYQVIAQSQSGNPAVDAEFELVDKENKVIWKSRTDNTGKAELWGRFERNSLAEITMIRGTYQGEKIEIQSPHLFGNGINLAQFQTACDVSNDVEICFAVDATGSMQDEIDYLRAELADIIGFVNTKDKDLSIKTSCVFYRDQGDTYLTREQGFTANPEETIQFITEQYADGGGDGPEALEAALNVAVNQMSWSEKARTRILFIVLDAPPHNRTQDVATIQTACKNASSKGIRIVPLVASGGGYDQDKSLEYLMRTIALATNGTYAFLTNDSGIGDSHTAPTTDSYEVETMNKLMKRIISEYTFSPECEAEDWINTLTALTDTSTTEVEMLDDTALHNSSDSSQSHINVLHHDLTMSCYPNPTSDYVMIQTSEKMDELYFADNSGKLIQQIKPDGVLTRLDLLAYPSGVYFVKAWVNNEWAQTRVVIARR